MAYADLHIHSNASDGLYPVQDILELVTKSNIVSALAITDHDTVFNGERAAELSSIYGIDIINGAEITTTYGGRAVHMLGYFIDAGHRELQRFLAESKRKRADRTLEMASRLHDAGLPIDPDELITRSTCLNRPALARMLMENGTVGSVNEAFELYLSSGTPYYVDVVYPDTVEALELIHEANGHSFIAHPARYRVVDLIAPLAAEGMEGIEVYHSKHSMDQSRELRQLAQDLGLGTSGGSDWHGDDKHAADIGAAGLDAIEYNAFLHACDRI